MGWLDSTSREVTSARDQMSDLMGPAWMHTTSTPCPWSSYLRAGGGRPSSRQAKWRRQRVLFCDQVPLPILCLVRQPAPPLACLGAPEAVADGFEPELAGAVAAKQRVGHGARLRITGRHSAAKCLSRWALGLTSQVFRSSHLGADVYDASGGRPGGRRSGLALAAQQRQEGLGHAQHPHQVHLHPRATRTTGRSCCSFGRWAATTLATALPPRAWLPSHAVRVVRSAPAAGPQTPRWAWSPAAPA